MHSTCDPGCPKTTQARRGSLWRGLAIATAVVLAACSAEEPDPFTVSRVEPPAVSVGATTPAIVLGERFLNDVNASLGSDDPQVMRSWRVQIGVPASASLTAARMNAENLSVLLPAGLPVGIHDVRVTSPAGETRTLLNGLTVFDGQPPDAGADGGAGTGGTGGTGGASGGSGGAAGVDAGGAGGALTGGTGGGTGGGNGDAGAPLFCDAADPDLVACLRFESATQPGKDESQYGNHGVSINVSLMPGHNGSAASFNPLSKILMPESPSLDVPHITMELWLRLDALPTGTRAGLIDNDGQYGFFVLNSGVLSCSATSGTALTTTKVSATTWTHVACTADSNFVKIYVDGVEQANAPKTGGINTLGTTGTSIGSNNPSGEILPGRIDDLRVWSVARTPGQICTAANICAP